MVRLGRLARETNATSIADLIASRLGKDAWLAATVTLVAALGLIPYVALQLKAMAMSFAMLTATPTGVAAPAWQDIGLYVALSMAGFAIQIGRPSGEERGCQYVSIPVGPVTLKKKKN